MTQLVGQSSSNPKVGSLIPGFLDSWPHVVALIVPTQDTEPFAP